MRQIADALRASGPEAGQGLACAAVLLRLILVWLQVGGCSPVICIIFCLCYEQGTPGVAASRPQGRGGLFQCSAVVLQRGLVGLR